jgi:hypothetical protein
MIMSYLNSVSINQDEFIKMLGFLHFFYGKLELKRKNMKDMGFAKLENSLMVKR